MRQEKGNKELLKWHSKFRAEPVKKSAFWLPGSIAAHCTVSVSTGLTV